ncbi:MAG TPA: competence/damage-inducible protein A [Chloroflexota bacterium]|jgi:nicotinamide-nucleotide amidase
MRAEILSIGTEMLLGQIVDTNANFLAQQLPPLGLDLFYVSEIGDNLSRLSAAFRQALDRSDVIITSGGLGPTEDDLTREAIAEVLGEHPRVVPELEASLREFFARRGRPMPERNVKQATLIPSASVLPNPVGTAPGWWVEHDGKVIASMPGVPHEMHKMWEEQVQPRLARRISGGVIISRVLKLIGIGESNAEEIVGDLTHSINPTLATYAKSDGIHLRLTAKAATPAEAEDLLNAFEPRVRARVAEWVYGTENDTLPMVVGAMLRERGLKLATAESATGGQLASLITEAPGASDYFVAGYVAYSADAKRALGVSPDILERYGTVAEATTQALAAAARQQAEADIAVATTGNAGPGASEDKPVGILHVVVDLDGRQVCSETRYSTTRTEYKRRGALDALYLLWRELKRGA